MKKYFILVIIIILITGIFNYSIAVQVGQNSGEKLAPGTVVENSDTTSPLNVTERSSAPSSPTSGDIYLDDGTNTGSGNPGWRRYTGAVWEDVTAAAGGAAPEGTAVLSTGEGGGTKFLREDGDGTCSWQAAGGASEIHERLKPHSAKFPSTNPAALDAANSGWRLLFDDTTDESATWEFVLDDDYGAGTLYCDVFFSMVSGEANEVQWECFIMAVTATTDDADWDTDSYDTENVGVTTVAATAGRPYKQTITLTNDDGLAAGDMIRVKISTDADDGTNDDATGDREFRYAVIRE